MSDRRRATRYLCRCRVGLFRASGRREMAWATDVSAEGVQIHASYPCHPGEVLDIALMIFNPLLEKTVEILSRATVTYCVFEGGRASFRIGLQFTTFEPGSDERLRQELARLGPNTHPAPVSAGSERRAERRYRYRRKVGIDLGNGTVLSAWTDDVSRSGLR
ncbi:MAG: PilZ domain-containing protein, partial [Chromatiales bacterium]|nr:PilZ domain-containing protein [Chromatiales bacterium]